MGLKCVQEPTKRATGKEWGTSLEDKKGGSGRSIRQRLPPLVHFIFFLAPELSTTVLVTERFSDTSVCVSAFDIQRGEVLTLTSHMISCMPCSCNLRDVNM